MLILLITIIFFEINTMAMIRVNEIDKVLEVESITNLDDSLLIQIGY